MAPSAVDESSPDLGIKMNDRKHSLKRPANWKPPMTRWMLKFPEHITHVHTIYLGVQSHARDHQAAGAAENAMQGLLHDGDAPAVIDTFRVTGGFDLVDSKVWVAYYTDADRFNAKLRSLDLPKVWRSLRDDKGSIGLWCESFTTFVERLESNYSRLDHKPGLARIPGTEQPGHTLTAYWGAARDRLPASADDLFEKPENLSLPSRRPTGFGQHLTGSNYDNICHIRSGQWWEKCDEEERDAYEQILEPTLMQGMQYLWEHPQETGTLGLRFLQNLDEGGHPTKETCGAGFHRNWADLEKWSSKHPSHLAIFNGAIKHAKRFGDERKFMTWHEVSILKAGEASFEYINCDPKTGVIRWVKLESKDLMEH